MKKLTALTGCGRTHSDSITSGILVNGLHIELVRQWIEYPTKQSFAVSVSTEVRRQYYLNDAAFSEAMREAGYLPVRTRKLTGKDGRFWLYRATGKDKGVVAEKTAPHKACSVFVQVSEQPRKAFKRVAVDGKWLSVYADHIRFLTKKRVRVEGKQVMGYTAKGLLVEVLA
ncbi:hypothetical protein [Obesumbacterium proteus]|uniref:hypothetical protein n=1 Tax=Obesumbacterium proteus TaxID=82983 RepID=UPI001F255A22|nr:hypothetical protein [Obesumbacterium proteus]MCE9886532.1 hypothetical protein [Obesumbacterium proteus]MCE9918092.1 hypothetical protein [Obesumbacterium proteus]MCE9931201.1 hypothetical protein [Obesumbacterium proteus]MCG2879156.1 hypothetical protein [Obesumbacterium proteus]